MGVKDYGEASEYYKDDYKSIQEDLEKIEKSKKTFLWIQEFSKKVIAGTFLAYLGITIFSAIMVYLSMKVTGSVEGLETLIVEMNNTFRDVVGGYLIKAGVENAVKIGGNYYVGIADAKLRALKERLGIPANDNEEENNTFDEGNEFDDEN